MNDNRHQDGIYPFPAGMQSREIETNGAKIRVRVGGNGPAVVMLHGFGTTGDMWGHLASALITVKLTAGPRGAIAPGYFGQIPLAVAIPDGDAGKVLTFKVVQTYSNGDEVRWIGAPSSDKPAPTIDITRKGGAIEDVAGTEAGPPPTPPGQGGSTSPTKAAVAKKSNGASKGLGIAALIVGVLGLLAGLTALAVSRRRPAGAVRS